MAMPDSSKPDPFRAELFRSFTLPNGKVSNREIGRSQGGIRLSQDGICRQLASAGVKIRRVGNWTDPEELIDRSGASRPNA